MNAQERLDYLLSDVWVPSQTLVTIGMLRDEIGLTAEEYTKVRTTLENAIATLKAHADADKRMQGIDLADALAGMLGKGVSLNGESRQSTIDLLAAFGQWSNELKAKIKTLGGTTRKRWQVERYESEPTLESLVTRNWWVAVKAVVDDRLHAGTITTQAEVVAIVGGK